MRMVPPEQATAFLLYLNDYVQDHETYFEIFKDRTPGKIQIEHRDGMDYTVIDFNDDLSLIIPGVYSQFEGSLTTSI